MKTRKYIAILVALLVSSLGLFGTAIAAPGGNPGPPDSDGGSAPVDYGDLIILLRDEDGVPILTPEGPNTGLCQQPLAFNVSDEPDTLCPSSCIAVDDYDEDVVNVDQATCAIAAGCAGCVKEIEFGRINEARSPASVFEAQLEDAIVTLATADCLTLDPAGRMVASTVDDGTGETLTKTIDSPLQNLAIYRELIMNGGLGVSLPQQASVLDTAARSLGAASDKSGGVNRDMVAYLNRVMGLSEMPTILDPKTCIDIRQEVQGVVQLVEECFLNYGDYLYNRGNNFLALPAPPYIPEGAGEPGWFEYLAVYDEQVPTFWIEEGPIVEAVFPDGLGSYVAYNDGNIGAFAQAADDARAVIDFMHSNPIPEGYETALVCEAAGDIFYDLSISEQSGLQVPKNYVSGTEREFTVTVANAGPDAANGSVIVTATADSVLLDEWTFEIVALPATQSASFTQLFAISTAADSITWEAEVVAGPPGSDPNPLNNTREVVSSVRASGGGGGGH